MINGVIWSYTIAMELGAEALVKGFHPRRDAGPGAMLVDEVATGFPRRSAKRGILHEPLNRASELILGSVNHDAAARCLHDVADADIPRDNDRQPALHRFER